jgi:hypothetical protein
MQSSGFHGAQNLIERASTARRANPDSYLGLVGTSSRFRAHYPAEESARILSRKLANILDSEFDQSSDVPTANSARCRELSRLNESGCFVNWHRLFHGEFVRIRRCEIERAADIRIFECMLIARVDTR